MIGSFSYCIAGNFSQENFFGEIHESKGICEILSMNVFLVYKDGLMALICKNIIREMLICENFLPQKFPAIQYPTDPFIKGYS